VPLDIVIRETSDAGNPIVVAQPDGEHARVFRVMAQRIWEKIAGQIQRPAPRIVIQ
jgi:ATP-binding protein involved in chromosome partitioning